MNTVPLTPAEIQAQNERAKLIVASHDADSKTRQRAQERLDKLAKETRVFGRVASPEDRTVRFLDKAAPHVGQHTWVK